MPHLRFTRDRRGYEHTFIVHRDRSGSGDRTLVLYWFRTPPDIRVGRSALDQEAMRAVEAEHPGIRFDWPRLFEAAGTEDRGSPNRPGREVSSSPADPLQGRRPRRKHRRPPGPGDEHAPQTPVSSVTAEADPAPHAED